MCGILVCGYYLWLLHLVAVIWWVLYLVGDIGDLLIGGCHGGFGVYLVVVIFGGCYIWLMFFIAESARRRRSVRVRTSPRKQTPNITYSDHSPKKTPSINVCWSSLIFQ